MKTGIQRTARRLGGQVAEAGDIANCQQSRVHALREAIEKGTYGPSNLEIAESWSLMRDLTGFSADRVRRKQIPC